MTLDVCIAQINYRPGHIRDHVERIKGLIREHRDADLIVFPELVLHGHPSLEKPEGFLYRRAKALYGRVSADVYRFVRETGARVILGQMQRRVDNLLNVATYVDGDGPQHYVKTHVHWTENFLPGRRLRTFHTPFGPVGINICFDAAFPEVWRVLALAGAEVIVNISAVPAHFPVALMHRRLAGAALDNQVFTVYANRPGPAFGGHSAVFGPHGERIAATDDGESVLACRVDLEEVARWRREEAIYPHRRPQLYRPIVSSARRGEGGSVPDLRVVG